MAKSQFDEEAIRATLQSILTEIHDQSDPTELNELRRIFRSAVPLFSRAYVAGYLLKKARVAAPVQARREDRPAREDRSRNDRSERSEERKEKPRREAPVREERVRNEDRKEAKPAAEDRKAPVAPAVPNENHVTLFVGIGRTRRVYPRDLMGLLMETCKLEKDDIGIIKILDNYSFVDVNLEKAQGVIDALNEFEFRGRSLSVNFAKKKE